MGARAAFDVSKLSDPVAAVRRLTEGGRGADSVIEAVGSPLTWEWALQMVRCGGTVNLFGGCPRGTQVQLDPTALHYSEITIKSTFHHTPRFIREALEAIARGEIRAARFRQRGNSAARAALDVRAHEASQRRDESRGDSLADPARVPCGPGAHRASDAETPCSHLPNSKSRARCRPPGCPLAQAEHYTRWLATHHYENFHVASWLLPRRLRQHFYNVYAYCRWADDLGDEVARRRRARSNCWTGGSGSWISATRAARRIPFSSRLRRPIREPSIFPSSPSAICWPRSARTRPCIATSPGTTCSAIAAIRPIPSAGWCFILCGYRDAERQRLSDATCTALQLANFWQDVSRDLDKGRIYIPLDACGATGLRPRRSRRGASTRATSR